MALTSTHDGLGNVTLYGGTATHDGAGNVVVTVTESGDEQAALAAFEQRVRTVKGRVELLDGSTILGIYGCEDALQSFAIERTGEGKFFGFGVGQKINVVLIDPNREIEVAAGNRIDASLGYGSEYFHPFPYFKVTEVNRDENTNALSITAYDALNDAAAHTVAELSLDTSYTILEFATACASLLGLPIRIDNAAAEAFATLYPDGANFEGSETVREALDAVAEATQTVYYVGGGWELTFKRPDRDGEAVYTIDREKYFTLTSGENKRLGTVCSATELGDNVSASLTVTGSTQYVRDNPFWDIRADVADLVDAALENVGGLTVNQFECEWRGNPLLEIGDKVAFETKDGGTVCSFLLDDTLTYDGTLAQTSGWSLEESEAEDADNPTSLGEAIKKTFARVDKAEANIQLYASITQNQIDAISGSVAEVQQSVSQTVTPEQLSVEIQKVTNDGVSKVTTSTGYTFDEDGLGVSKTGCEMSTQVTEDGLRVNRSGEEVLRADNQGVKAEDLHATTYLVIGDYSRFENWEDAAGEKRTACFWVGNVQNKTPEDTETETETEEGDEE